MKKSLIALAVLASAGAAYAQSSVTLFGIVDATIARGTGSISKKFQLTNSGYNSSRLGFRGTEDLGGGMAASFWLEAGVSNDDGQGAPTNNNNQSGGVFNSTTGANAPVRPGSQGLTFNRRSTVSLSGGWGEVRLGRDYTPQFWNLTVFDPFGTNGVGTTQTLSSSLGGPVIVRASNSMGYFLPGNLGGFYGQLMHYRGENNTNSFNSVGQSNNGDGNGTSVRVGYGNGPVNVALAYAKTKYATGDIKSANLGGQYDFGVAKLMGHYARDEVSNGATGKGYLIGGLVPVGPGEIRLAYSQYKNNLAGDPKTRKFALGYVHNLSKRTALYVTAARVRNDGGAAQALNGATTAANGSSNGYDFGIRHSF